MDSGGNSGSLLSSSEADEEYDSRAAVDSVSPFIPGRPIPQPPSFFDPIPNYLHLHQSQAVNWAGSSQPGPKSYSVPDDEVGAKHHQLASPPPRPPAARNPRKRSRASRRAPTTVLTTDTTNFRAMVQEFTGIPSPPLGGGGSRFDLFGRFGSAQPPTYLRRPFAQKMQSPLPFLTAAPSSLFTSAAAVPISSGDSIQISQINNYQLQQTHKTPNQFAINSNQIFTSILQSNPKFPSSNPALIPPRSQAINSFNLIDDQFVSLGHDGNPDSPRWSSNPETPNAGAGAGGFSFRPS